MDSELHEFRSLMHYLEKYGNHIFDCPARAMHCICGHINTQHFPSHPFRCAHCDCKKFTNYLCTCGWDKVKKLLKLKG